MPKGLKFSRAKGESDLATFTGSTPGLANPLDSPQTSLCDEVGWFSVGRPTQLQIKSNLQKFRA